MASIVTNTILYSYWPELSSHSRFVSVYFNKPWSNKDGAGSGSCPHMSSSLHDGTLTCICGCDSEFRQLFLEMFLSSCIGLTTELYVVNTMHPEQNSGSVLSLSTEIYFDPLNLFTILHSIHEMFKLYFSIVPVYTLFFLRLVSLCTSLLLFYNAILSLTCWL